MQSCCAAPVAVAGPGAAGAAGALRRGGLANPAHLEARQPRPPLEQPLLGTPRVHHVTDACGKRILVFDTMSFA